MAPWRFQRDIALADCFGISEWVGRLLFDCTGRLVVRAAHIFLDSLVLGAMFERIVVVCCLGLARHLAPRFI